MHKPSHKEIFEGNLALLKQRVAALEAAAQKPQPNTGDAQWSLANLLLDSSLKALSSALGYIENNSAEALKDLL